MKRIKAKDTSIEIILRKALWKKGYRYRKNCKDVIGKPVFCDSEFWHGKYFKENRYIPKTNKKFWIEKLERNIERDKTVNINLKKKGWIVLRFWETDIRKNINKCIEKFEKTYNQL